MKQDDRIDSAGRTDEDLIEQVDALRQKKKRPGRIWIRAAAVAACLAVIVAAAGCLAEPQSGENQLEDAVMQKVPEEQETSPETAAPAVEEDGPEQVPANEKWGQTELAELDNFPAETLQRLRLLDFSTETGETVTPSVAPYSVASDFSNVVNLDQFYLSEEALLLLRQNLFVVSGIFGIYNNEFFEGYEYNRYALIPNFVTVDSLMHTYHLYFSLLLNRTEKEYLAEELLALSKALLETSAAQYRALEGTQWEEAARRNVAFFAVAAALQEPELELPACAEELARWELEQVCAASGIIRSRLVENEMDYSQFKPRGYYEGDEVLERYFRAMMWYGQVNFAQSNESLTQSALLMTLAMAQTDLPAWEEIYTVTSFFAGASDDLGYYEYAPAIEEVYGGYPSMEELQTNGDAFEKLVALLEDMTPPAINSVPVYEEEEGDLGEMNKGFRFMGQRFTVDAAMMQQLVYRAVEGKNSQGQKRLLPDTLDVPAALGSETAMKLLEAQGETEYGGYTENMEELRTILEGATEESWTTSLYSSWLYTLTPLLEETGAGYPSFMTSTEWEKKNLETFAGSYTELKHDTVLYAKQVMAEMGGGPPEVLDDRGYVEPEPEVYRRFMLLAQQTAQGLDGFGLLNSSDRENLSRLEELARRLMVISNKELQDEILDNEEYDLIRDYGGTLEHFWIEAMEDRIDAPYLDPQENPASLVTDIATDPNGWVLQVATGKPSRILVIVPVDGTLRIASGVVYDFYQFEQPLGERLTDTEWRQMTGEWADESGMYHYDNLIEKPWWTESYWVKE